MQPTPVFPAPFRLNGRLVWDRHEIENHKRILLGLPPLARKPEEPIVFVGAKQLVTELPFGRRWLGKIVQGRFRELPSGAAARNQAQQQPATA
jgi:hypothetical protein